MKDNRKTKGFRKALIRDLGKEQAERIMEAFWPRYEEICAENPGETKELQEHSVAIIYPTVAMADTLQKFGFTREKAVKWLYNWFEKEAEGEARSMQMMLKIPGAYRMVPGMFISTQEKSFGAKAGFESKIIINKKSHTHFDMLKCPYNDLFRKYGYPDLIPCLCHQDDVKNEHMHPRLKWHREETLGSGGSRCDFSMEIIDKK